MTYCFLFADAKVFGIPLKHSGKNNSVSLLDGYLFIENSIGGPIKRLLHILFTKKGKPNLEPCKDVLCTYLYTRRMGLYLEPGQSCFSKENKNGLSVTPF